MLSPDDPSAWKRWAKVQITRQRYEHAAASLERYFELGGSAAPADAEALAMRRELRRILPGGDLAQADQGQAR